MKYINREYGFEGRPPFFKDYFEEKSKGPGVVRYRFPSKGTVGLGLDYSAPNSVLFAGKLGTVWGAKISYFKLGKKIDSEAFNDNLGNYYAASQHGDYSYFSHGDITASIVAYSATEAVISVNTMKKVKIQLEFYPIAPSGAKIETKFDCVYGSARERAVIPGDLTLSDSDMIFRDRYEVEMEELSSRKEYFFAKSYSPPVHIEDTDGKIVFEYNLDENNSRIMFFVRIGKEMTAGEGEVPSLDELNIGVSKAELVFTASKTVGSGELAKFATSLVSRCVWHKIYDPFIQSPVYCEDRQKCNPHYSYDPTELACGALVATLVGDYDVARKQLKNCAGEKIFGAYATWVLYCRTRNIEVISNALPKLIESVGLKGDLVMVDKETHREIAYKQTRSPLKELLANNLISLDMSSYKLLSLDIMERMARILRHPAQEALALAKNELKEKINKYLYNPRLGIYMDRYFEGEFVGIYGANSFLPLIAGAVENNDVVQQLAINLRDPKKFGGEFAVPTIEKQNPLYGKRLLKEGGGFYEPYEGYRGMISPYLNLFIHAGLKRYGISDVQSEVALSSARQYSYVLDKYNITPSFYVPSKRIKPKNAVAQSLSGNLLGLIGLTELLDVEYFREDLRPALSFGTLAKGDHRFANIQIFGHNFAITTTNHSTSLFMEDIELFKATGGKTMVRQFAENEKGLEFVIYATKETTINVRYPLFTSGSEVIPYTFNVEAGKTLVIIDKFNVEAKKLKFNT